jgi:transglutaminase-like putative cysteine protease
MRFTVTHTTTYTYSRPVKLASHLIRLRPRSDGHQTLQTFELLVSPMPVHQSALTDLDGNALTQLRFGPEPTPRLEITTRSQVITHLRNPFDYLLEPWTRAFPFDYPTTLLARLHPYLQGYSSPHLGIDPAVVALAQDLVHRVQGNVSDFLTQLNQQIHDTCRYHVRDTGMAHPPGLTLAHGRGSCRDLTVLFMEACRAVGLAARFVSGYHCLAGRMDAPFHLHAWAEVYLPGAGWRGFDCTQRFGAVGDRYIPLVASPHPRDTLPIQGSTYNYGEPLESTLDYHIAVQPWDEEASPAIGLSLAEPSSSGSSALESA